MKPADQAKDLIDLIQGELDGHDSPLARRIILGKLDRFIEGQSDTPIRPKPKQPQEAAMSDSQARAFETTRISFGKHEEEMIGCVPIRYLVWVVDTNSFRKELGKYLRSRLGQERIEREDQ